MGKRRWCKTTVLILQRLIGGTAPCWRRVPRWFCSAALVLWRLAGSKVLGLASTGGAALVPKRRIGSAAPRWHRSVAEVSKCHVGSVAHHVGDEVPPWFVAPRWCRRTALVPKGLLFFQLRTPDLCLMTHCP